jgi:F0F1-type ATP synthase beta subunit
MRVSSDWLHKIDGWRRTQADLPSRAEAVRRLVGMGLRFGIEVGDEVSTPVGRATVNRIMPAIGQVIVETKNGDSHAFALAEINAVDEEG